MTPTPGETHGTRFFRSADAYDHGSRSRYRLGCRCEPCTEAQNAYQRARRLARAQGRSNPLVAADDVRVWLRALEAKGIGVRRVGELAQVRWTLVYRLRSGQQQHVRRQTAAAILSIRPSLAKGQTVPSYHTRQLIDAMTSEGYTKARIARFLRLRTPQVQLHNQRVTVRNALRVRGLYRYLMGED